MPENAVYADSVGTGVDREHDWRPGYSRDTTFYCIKFLGSAVRG